MLSYFLFNKNNNKKLKLSRLLELSVNILYSPLVLINQSTISMIEMDIIIDGSIFYALKITTSYY